MPGSSTDCAQPVRSATRPRRSPSGVKLTPGRMLVFARQALRARARSIASSRAPGRPEAREQRHERPAEPREPQRRAEAARDRAAPRRAARASAGRRAAAGRSSRSAPAPGRRGACSRRPTGRWSCRRGRRGSGRYGARPRRRRLVVLQHVLDQVDAAARRIELVAELQIGRAGRRGRSRNARSGAGSPPPPRCFGSASWASEKLTSASGRPLSPSGPGLRMPRGSNCSFSRRDSAASASGCGSKGGTAARSAGLPRISVAWPPPTAATAVRISRARPSGPPSSTSSQTSPPDQS